MMTVNRMGPKQIGSAKTIVLRPRAVKSAVESLARRRLVRAGRFLGPTDSLGPARCFAPTAIAAPTAIRRRPCPALRERGQLAQGRVRARHGVGEHGDQAAGQLFHRRVVEEVLPVGEPPCHARQ